MNRGGMQSMGSNSSGSSTWLGVQNKLSDCFELFISEFQTQIDFHFKTYNRNLRDSSLEVQLKASKKEKLRYQQFLVHEEKEYWKDFPRKLVLYNDYLRRMHELFCEKGSSNGSKDVSLIITNILNIMPIASKKYRYRFGLEAVFHQDLDNKITFDTVTEQLKMFDSDDQKNWKILGFLVTIFASDIISILLDQQSQKEVQISSGVIDLLLEICKHFSIVQTFQDEGIEEDTILDIYFKQVQVAWAKIFGNLSKLSFDKCMKFLMSSLLQDFRKMKEEDTQVCAQRIYFCRFLQIAPNDKLTASHLQILLDNMCNLLVQKYITPQMKNVLLMTLKFFVEQLAFYADSISGRRDIVIDSPMGILWPVIETMYQITEKCRKKELLKEYAMQLMIVLIKISPNDFFNEKMGILIKSQKIPSFFDSKKTYNHGLQLMMEVSCLRATPFNKYQDWNPATQARQYLLLEDKSHNLTLPIKEYRSTQKFKLMRRIFPSDLIPIPFKESFKLVFNLRIMPELSTLHYQYLQQMAFEDLEFTCTQGIQYLLSVLRSPERYDVPILGLKLIDFMLSPLYDFKGQYLKLWPKSQQFIEENLSGLYTYSSIIIKEILRSPLLKSDYLTDLSNFFKSDDKELCNDQLSIVWSVSNNGDEESTFRRASPISQHIKSKGLGKFYLQEEKRVISFEEFKEIQQMSAESENEYQNQQLNQIAKGIEKEMKDWDYKKEKFIRHRLSCYLSEERKEGSRQNTSQFGISAAKKEETKLLKHILKMLHYLPEVQEYFKFYPLKNLLNDEQAFLTNKVPEINFNDFDDGPKLFSLQGPSLIGQTSGGIFNEDRILTSGFSAQQTLNIRSRRKSGGNAKQPYTNPKLREFQNLIPYLLMNADYDIVSTANRELQRMIVFGDFKIKIGIMDQILYLLKELMLESPEEYLVTQILQQTIKLVKVWHASEKNKIRLNDSCMEKMSVEGLPIISLNPFREISQQQKSQNNKMKEFRYIFETLDMISLLGMNNKDRIVRQLSVILMAENGKLQRLLMPKEQGDYRKSLYDIIYYDTDQLKEQIVKIVVIMNCFKSGEFKSEEELTKLMKDISPFQLIVDNFDYKKSGLNESLVRDIQIILMGEIFIKWKKILLSSGSPASSQILNFINTLSQRTLFLFETKNESEVNLTKDYVGLNLLMAIILYNVSHSHGNLHVTPKQTENSSEGQQQDDTSSQQTIPQILSTNSVIEDFQNLIGLLELDIQEVYKAPFGKFYPLRFSISSVLLAFYYQLQDPIYPKSIENLKDIFQMERAQSKQTPYYNNCILFYTLLTLNANERFIAYVKNDTKQLGEFTSKIQQFFYKNESFAENETARKQKLVLFVNYIHSMLLSCKTIYKKEQFAEIKKLITPKNQYYILEFTKAEHDHIERDESLKREFGWLLLKIKEIWHMILSFQLIFGRIPNIKFDLKFLISLESQGFTVLKYYKYLNNNNQSFASTSTRRLKNIQEEIQQEFTVNELKHLLNQVYLFYNPQLNPIEQLQKKNPYYKCFIKNIVGGDVLLSFLKQKNFSQVYGQLTSSCLRSTKALIETKIKQFISNGLHSKYFLVGLFMSLNSEDRQVRQQSKILCLSVLPLMFDDEKFREIVESMIVEHEDIDSLVASDNKTIVRFLKQVFKDEENFNMKHHFEKYFSISGLLRNILNEIIKLQTISFSQRTLLKILDIVTYFIGNLQLRRAPLIDEKNSFIFDNLIDYKSFEFLSKLYKISEKLVDLDDEFTVMNMWYKVVEGKIQNFEILAKFLVHNLSSFIMKLKQATPSVEGDMPGQKKGTEYSLEYEKQKRYALSIFNYIKARVQQMDVRNSINLSATSVSWSQKMIRLMSKAALNLQSKYVLEKIKLKKILQLLHSEINECGIRLQLKGGLMQIHEFVNNENQRVSLNMGDLLQSKTFLETFSATNRRDKTIMKNLVFRIRRIMNEKFNEISGSKSQEQMPEMIIKYLENSLVFITNDVERPTQVIKFTLKEELTIVIVMIILIVDLIIRDKNENRFYFLLETFNKLQNHVGSVSKYFNFKNFTPQNVFSKETQANTRILSVVNLRVSIDHFGQYTKLHFKMIQNLNSSPIVQYHMIKLWLQIFQKHREVHQSTNLHSQVSASNADLLQMKAQDALLYSRNLILTLIQNAFFNICEVSQMKKETTANELKYCTYNFKQHFNCILEYVLPSGQLKMQQIKSTHDPDSIHVAFATNAIFWIAYSCLECASLINEEPLMDLATELQTIGMHAITKVLEKSDFLKMLIGVQKLSDNFFAYSLSMSKRNSSFLSLIFDSLDNPHCLEDAMKSLIITIRVQDYQLLNASCKRELAEIELQRLLYLIPFFMQQFSFIMHSQVDPNNKGRAPIFGSYRSIILLLKKSLPSIGIDKKKDVFELLDIIQKEAEKNEDKLINKEFEQLTIATVSLCNQLGYQQVIFDCESTFLQIKEDIQSSKTEPAIDKAKIEMVVRVINEFIVGNQIQTPDSRSMRETLAAEMIQNIYTGEILGEEAASIKREMRPIYFGLKNIILKEIEGIDREIDIQKFFFDESSLKNSDSVMNSMQSSNLMPKRNSTISGAVGASQLLSHSVTLMSMNSVASPMTKEYSGDSLQNQQLPPQFQNAEMTEADFSNVVKKITIRRQETASKYQNSQPSKQFGMSTPQDKKITELSGNFQRRGSKDETILSQSRIPAILLQRLATQHQHSQLISNQAQHQMLFEDEEIHTPVQRQMSVGTSKSIKHDTQQSRKQQARDIDSEEPIEIPFIIGRGGNTEEQDNHFSHMIVDNSDYFEAGDPEQFEVIQEEEENNQNAQAAHSSGSEDPRERFKQMIKRNKNLHLQFPPHETTFKEKVQQSSSIIYDGDAGGIVTFSKPKAHDDQRKTLLSKEIAFNPNYVADRTSQIFSELQGSNAAYSQQNFYRAPDSMLQHDDAWRSTGFNKKKQNPLQNYPWLQEDNQKYSQKSQAFTDHEVATKANDFFDSIKNEELPTPKKQSNKLESNLVLYLTDKELFLQFEKFLTNVKKYDVDFLHFYVKVMEFKQEVNVKKAFLIAGIIIDSYLSDSADNYISIDSRLVTKVIKEYEALSLLNDSHRAAKFDVTLFDLCTYQIEKDLITLVDEFRKQ